MRRTTMRPTALLVLCVIAVACTGAPLTTQAPQTPAATQALQSPAATQAPPATESPAATTSFTDTPADLGTELIQPGELTICSAFPRLRFAEFDAQGNPFGVDIDIGLAIAGEMGLRPDVREGVFDDLIGAVVDRRCDVAISGHFITQERLQLIDLIPYREGSVSPVVRVGNPLRIDELTDLCARSVAIVAGTIYHDIVRGLGEYAGSGVDQQCEPAGRPPVDLAEHDTEADAVAALSAGEADAYIGNEAIAVERSDEFQLSTAELPRLRNGIGHRKEATVLDDSIRSALRALIGNGTYAAILERYGASSGALTELP